MAGGAEKSAADDAEGGLTLFFDAIEGPGGWTRLPAAAKQQLRDNAMRLIGQTRDKRPPFSRADAEAIKTPTLFIGGPRTKRAIPKVLHTLAAHVAGAKPANIPRAPHPLFEQTPRNTSPTALPFLPPSPPP